MSESRKHSVVCVEAIKRLHEGNKGRIVSVETRKKMSKSQLKRREINRGNLYF